MRNRMTGAIGLCSALILIAGGAFAQTDPSPRDETAALNASVETAAPDNVAGSPESISPTDEADRPEAGDAAPPAAPASETSIEPSEAALLRPSPAEAVGAKPSAAKAAPTASDICGIIRDHADTVGMDRNFFARLIWKESRFDVKAVSPVGARGIAQFMPYTAKERGLVNPYDYEEAIKHSALYLRDLRNELGNWGLAAAAYNGGINRMKRWVAGGASGPLPFETVEYVNAITFRPIVWFTEDGRDVEPRPLDAERDFMEGCARLPIMRTRAVFASLGDDGGPDAAPPKPWGAQVAGHPRRETAQMIFGRLQKKFPAVFGSQQPIIMRARNNAGNRIYAVRMGADTRDGAETFCNKLRGVGGFCTVLKNR